MGVVFAVPSTPRFFPMETPNVTVTRRPNGQGRAWMLAAMFPGKCMVQLEGSPRGDRGFQPLEQFRQGVAVDLLNRRCPVLSRLPIASVGNLPVESDKPLSALPILAPWKLRTREGGKGGAPRHRLHWKRAWKLLNGLN